MTASRDLPEPWQLYPMPPEQVAAIERHIARQAQAAVDRERDRIRSLLRRPLLNVLRCVPDGEIRDGCLVYDGETAREQARQAYLDAFPDRTPL